MKKSFKKGDKVICIDAERRQYFLGSLTKGETYTVKRVDQKADAVFLDEIEMYNGLPYAANRFKKGSRTKMSQFSYSELPKNDFVLKEIDVSYKKKRYKSVKINGSCSVANIFKNRWNKKLLGIQEQFVVMYLDKGNNILGFKEISTGGISSTITDVRIILSIALNTLASSIILAHNHPSGTMKPSDEDKRITYKIQEAARLFDIQVIDHIILSENDYFSFADNHLIFN